MRTRRGTIESRSILSENENRDAPPLSLSDESSSPPTSSSRSTTRTTTIPPATTTSAITTTQAVITATTTTTTTAADDDTENTTQKSHVWQYFKRCSNVLPLKAKCLLCQEELLTPNYATSSMRRHLAQRHLMKDFESAPSSRSSTTTVSLTREEKRKLDSLAIDAIVKDSRVFYDFHKPGFQKLLDALKPGT